MLGSLWTVLGQSPLPPIVLNTNVTMSHHIAGDMAVRIFDSLQSRGFLKTTHDKGGLGLTRRGEEFVIDFGIDLDGLKSSRRPICRACLDWSERRNHLAGSLGAALLVRFQEEGWLRREKDSRVVHISKSGHEHLEKLFPCGRD